MPIGLFMAVGNGGPSGGGLNDPNLVWAFDANSGSLAPVVGTGTPTFTGGNQGTFFTNSGTMTQATTNAARFDYDPVSLSIRGWIVEATRTNSIRNNTMVGAAAGTPGTNPTNWTLFAAANGLTRTIVGTGTESGIAYIDVQISGTPSATVTQTVLASFEGSTSVAAANGQTWTSSSYASLVGGSLANVSNLCVSISERDGAGANLALSTSNFTPGNALAAGRFSHTRTLNNASTAFVLPSIRFDYTSGQAVNFTLRIGLPQLEQGAFATDAIPTSTVAVARTGDVDTLATASITGFSTTTPSIYWQGEAPPNDGTLFSLNDGTANNFIEIVSVSGHARFQVTTAGVSQADIDLGAWTVGTVHKVAGSCVTNAINASMDGVAGTQDTVAVVPTVTTVTTGQRTSSTQISSTRHRQARIYKATLTSAQLNALTT